MSKKTTKKATVKAKVVNKKATAKVEVVNKKATKTAILNLLLKDKFGHFKIFKDAAGVFDLTLLKGGVNVLFCPTSGEIIHESYSKIFDNPRIIRLLEDFGDEIYNSELYDLNYKAKEEFLKLIEGMDFYENFRKLAASNGFWSHRLKLLNLKKIKNLTPWTVGYLMDTENPDIWTAKRFLLKHLGVHGYYVALIVLSGDADLLHETMSRIAAATRKVA